MSAIFCRHLQQLVSKNTPCAAGLPPAAPTPTWILIPGLGADERLFGNMVDLLPKYEILKFAIPQPEETIEAYAQRLTQTITLPADYIICGVSFGGMMASILAEQLQPRALVLMSSTAHPAALNHALRLFEWLSRLMPDTFAAWSNGLGRLSMQWLEPMPPEVLEVFRDMNMRTPLEMIRQGGRMIMQWQKAPQVRCPIYHLHGGRDPLMPLAKLPAPPTHIVESAGHLLNLTHPAEVRDFIRGVLHQVVDPS
ncbi:MAG: hypothetical protein HJJLKODD_01222 [Phycisphaerae bacterium]|nr:hypothetical protein [Phycisphaerae bacterium]